MFANIKDEICRLGSEELNQIFCDTVSCTRGIELEIVSGKRQGDPGGESQPAATVGIPWRKPVIRIAEFLQDDERCEAIAHEIGHLLLVYRFGLGLVGRRMPQPWSTEELLFYFSCMGSHWDYLLGQVTNTAHHLILTDYLREKYGIGSRFHFSLLSCQFEKLAREDYEDRESLYAQGLIAFEYEKLGGDIAEIAPLNSLKEEIRHSYLAARRHFDLYGLETIPSPSTYRKNILSFLEDLGYPKEGFVFSQPRIRRARETRRPNCQERPSI